MYQFFARFEALPAVRNVITLCWAVTPSSLVVTNVSEEPAVSITYDRRWIHDVAPKRRYLFTEPHAVTTQKLVSQEQLSPSMSSALLFKFH